MGHDVQHLNSAKLIIPLDHMFKTVFPVQRRHQITFLIHRKESAVPVNYLFNPQRLHVFSPEAFFNILRHSSFLVPTFVSIDSITSFILAVHLRNFLICILVIISLVMPPFTTTVASSKPNGSLCNSSSSSTVGNAGHKIDSPDCFILHRFSIFLP